MTDVTPSQLTYLKYDEYRLVMARYIQAKEALTSAAHAFRVAEEEFRDVAEELLELEHKYDEPITETETCYYCGRPLDSLSGKPKRRKELATWYKLHPACAQSWDNESRR